MWTGAGEQDGQGVGDSGWGSSPQLPGGHLQAAAPNCLVGICRQSFSGPQMPENIGKMGNLGQALPWKNCAGPSGGGLPSKCSLMGLCCLPAQAASPMCAQVAQLILPMHQPWGHPCWCGPSPGSQQPACHGTWL